MELCKLYNATNSPKPQMKVGAKTAKLDSVKILPQNG